MTASDDRAEETSATQPSTALERVRALVEEVALELRPTLNRAQVTLDSALDRDLGIDSLARAELVARLEDVFGVALPDTVFAGAETARDLADAIAAASAKRAGGESRAVAQAPGGAVIDGVPWDVATLLDVLDWHAERHPSRAHIRFYDDEGDGEVLTYGALGAEARRVAAALQSRGIAAGDAVAIVLPTERSYFTGFFGVLLAGGVPVPAYPPARASRIEEHVHRLVGILDNSRARALIAGPEVKRAARLVGPQLPGLETIVTPDELTADAGAELLRPVVGAADLALLQYTSGSTGNPKGVMLTHGNLLANIRAMVAATRATADDVFVSWLPLYHDMGLIAAWLGSLYAATPLVVMPPLRFLARPVRWLNAIHRFRGTISGAPNFAYELCLRRIKDTELAGLDLSSWRYAFNGAEPVRAATIERFSARFAAYGFPSTSMAPVYGLAENSVGVTFPPPGRGPLIDTVAAERLRRTGQAVPAEPGDTGGLQLVACGLPLDGHQVRIVDDAGRELPDRHEGNLEFQGPSASQGYFRNPDATKTLFDGDWLRSGDRGYIAEGELYVTGREKDLIIRGGRNIQPTDVEEWVGAVDGVLPGQVAAFGSADPKTGTDRLIVLAESRKRDADVVERIRGDINAVVADQLGEPPDEVVIAPPNTIPRTSSGKIRRMASREIFEAKRIGEDKPPSWLQVLRLYAATLVPMARKTGRRVSSAAFAARAWFFAGLLAPIFWIATVIVPGVRNRWRTLGFGSRMLARLAGIPVSLVGRERLPAPGHACIVVANHSSYIDGFTLIALLPHPVRFVAKVELSHARLTDLPLRRLGALYVERFDVERGLGDFEVIRRAAGQGETPLFFAEGTFRRMPGLLPFHMGAFLAAAEAGLPIVPIAIRGTRSVLRDGSWFPRRGRVTVTICPAIEPPASGRNWERAVHLRDRTRAAILRHCGEPDLERERIKM